MKNPNGPYPGRQLFLGLTLDQKPCFAYLVTGRSPESRERKAIQMDDVIRIGPLGNVQYDPLRHYAGVKYDNTTGLAAVTNGIQTEAIYETYKLLFNTAAQPEKGFMEKILDGAGAEPDSYHTPRIAGMITLDKSGPVLIIGMKAFNLPAKAHKIELKSGSLTGISTYKGDMDKPEARNPGDVLSKLEFKGISAESLSKLIFDISAATYKDNDIRVCAVGGVRTGNKWELAIKNVH